MSAVIVDYSPKMLLSFISGSSEYLKVLISEWLDGEVLTSATVTDLVQINVSVISSNSESVVLLISNVGPDASFTLVLEAGVRNVPMRFRVSEI